MAYGAWNTADEFIAGGVYITPTTAGVFFDGTQFTEPAPIVMTSSYYGNAEGLYFIDWNGGALAQLTGTTGGRAVEVGDWNADASLTATNGSVSGTLENFRGESWATYVNGVRTPEIDAGWETLRGTLHSTTSDNGRMQGGRVSLNYRGVDYQTTGSWAAQSSNDGFMIGGTVNGTSVDSTGRDSFTFAGAFLTDSGFAGTDEGGEALPAPGPPPGEGSLPPGF